MKNLIIWIAKIFNVPLKSEVIVYKDKIVKIEKQGFLDGALDGDIYVKGNISSNGSICAGKGNIVCYTTKEEGGI